MTDTHVQPTVELVEVKQPKNPQDDDVEKTSECPDERRPVTEQIEDTAKVKITKEKSEPRDQANRNSPDSRSLRSGSWACQSPVLAQMQDPTDQSVLKSVEIHQVQQRQVPTVWVPHVLHRDKFVNQRIVTYRLKPSRRQRKHHICDRVDAGANDAESDGKLWKCTRDGFPDTGSYDPKAQTKMFRTSRLQEIVEVP